jgi:hypothetical protein
MIKMESGPTATASSILVVLNWFEELKRAVLWIGRATASDRTTA